MTYLEKVKSMDKSELSTILIEDHCPSRFGLKNHCVEDTGGFDCESCWNREIPEEPQEQPTDTPTQPEILDSGNRREFETGAKRDISDDKGRCDLMPLDVIANWVDSDAVLISVADFCKTGLTEHLYDALIYFIEANYLNRETVILDLAKHFEAGAKKYGERNWQKGIPVRCYIDSAVRHYLKFLRGDQDEPHDRAFVWNIVCAIWTCEHKPELNEYARED